MASPVRDDFGGFAEVEDDFGGVSGEPASDSAPREIPLHETALAHGANGFGLGAGPKVRGLYAAGEGAGADTGNPLVTAMDVLTGLYRKVAGDPEAAKRYEAAKEQEKAYLEETRAANPKTAFVSEMVGGAPTASLVASVAPVAKGTDLVSRAITGASQGATVGAAYGAGAGDVPRDALKGALGGAVVGGAVPVVAEGASRLTAPVRDYVAGRLRAGAEDAARRATGATQADITKLTRENPNRPREIGAALLDEDLRLRDPKTLRGDAKALRGDVGQEIGALVKQADQAGAGVDVQSFATRAKADIIDPIAANPAQKAPGHHGAIVNPAADRLNLLVNEISAKAQNGKISVADAHLVRQQLDELLRGVRRSQDPESTILKSAINDLRGLLSDEIGTTMNRAGLGDAWSEANRRFGLAADVQKLAQKGADRREGNRMFGFAEQVAGAGGLAGGLGLGGGPGAVVGYAASAGTAALGRRYGAPVAARTLDTLSSVLRTNPQALGQYAPRLLTMEAQRGAEGLAAAHYVLSLTEPGYRARWSTVSAGEGETE